MMLIVLATAHSLNASFLSLEAKWLAVAGIPILIGLFAGGFITKFKGLGIELESTLQQSVDEGYVLEAPEVSLQASDIAAEAEVVAKGSLEQLDKLSPEKKNKVKRLSFITQRHYYSNVIEDYIRAFPDLQFLEVRNRTGALSCILPVKAINTENMDSFVDSLERATVQQDFRAAVIKHPVLSQDSFLVAIDKLRISGLDSLPVLEQSEVVGVLDRSSAFDRLASTLAETRLKG